MNYGNKNMAPEDLLYVAPLFGLDSNDVGVPTDSYFIPVDYHNGTKFFALGETAIVGDWFFAFYDGVIGGRVDLSEVSQNHIAVLLTSKNEGEVISPDTLKTKPLKQLQVIGPVNVTTVGLWKHIERMNIWQTMMQMASPAGAILFEEKIAEGSNTFEGMQANILGVITSAITFVQKTVLGGLDARVGNADVKRVVWNMSLTSTTQIGGCMITDISAMGSEIYFGGDYISKHNEIEIITNSVVHLDKDSKMEVDGYTLQLGGAGALFNLGILLTREINVHNGSLVYLEDATLRAGDEFNIQTLHFLSHASHIFAYCEISIMASTTLSNSGTMESSRKVSLQTDILYNDGMINGTKVLNINADQYMGNGTLIAVETVTNVRGEVRVETGGEIIGEQTNITASNLYLDGKLHGGKELYVELSSGDPWQSALWVGEHGLVSFDKFTLQEGAGGDTIVIKGKFQGNSFNAEVRSNLNFSDMSSDDVTMIRKLMLKFLEEKFLSLGRPMKVEEIAVLGTINIKIQAPLLVESDDPNRTSIYFETQNLTLSSVLSSKGKSEVKFLVEEAIVLDEGSQLFIDGASRWMNSEGGRVNILEMHSARANLFGNTTLFIDKILLERVGVQGLPGMLLAYHYYHPGHTQKIRTDWGVYTYTYGVMDIHHDSPVLEKDYWKNAESWYPAFTTASQCILHKSVIEASGPASEFNIFGAGVIAADEINLSHSVMSIVGNMEILNAGMRVNINSSASVTNMLVGGNSLDYGFSAECYNALTEYGFFKHLIDHREWFIRLVNVHSGWNLVIPDRVFAAKLSIYGNVTGELQEINNVNNVITGATFSEEQYCTVKNHGDFIHCFQSEEELSLEAVKNAALAQKAQLLNPEAGIAIDRSLSDISIFLKANSAPAIASDAGTSLAGDPIYLYRALTSKYLSMQYSGIKFWGLGDFMHHLIDPGMSMHNVVLLFDAISEQFYTQQSNFLQIANTEVSSRATIAPTSQEEFFKIQNKQHKELYDNALSYKDRLGLRFGIPLTEREIAELKHKILWPVKKKWEGQDVYVPYLYIPNDIVLGSDLGYGAILELSYSNLKVHEIYNTGLIRTSGNTRLDVDNFYHISTLKNEGSLEIVSKAMIYSFGQIKGKGELTLQAIQDVVIMSLLYSQKYGNGVVPHLVSNSIIEHEGKILIGAGRDYKQVGAKVDGSDVHVYAGNDIAVVPVAVYNEKLLWAKRYHERIAELKYEQASIVARVGEINIHANNNIDLVAPKMTSAGNTTIKAEGNVTESYVAEVSEFSYWKKSKKLFSSKSTSYNRHNENILAGVFNAGGAFVVSAGGHSKWQGFEIRGKLVKFESSNPEHAALVEMTPAYKYSEINVKTKKSGFRITMSDGKFSTYGYKFGKSKEAVHEVIPNIIQMEDQFLGFVDGNWVQLSTEIKKSADGKASTIHIKADNVELSVVPNLAAKFMSITKAGNGIGFSDKSGEFAIKTGFYYNKQSYSRVEERYELCPMISDHIIIEAGDRFVDHGIYYEAQTMQTSAKIEFHGKLFNRVIESHKELNAEVGIKLGIKSNFGRVGQLAQGMAQNNYNTPEGVVSGVFMGLEMYDTILTVLSPAAGFGIQGGAWFYLEVEQSERHSEWHQIVPTVYRIGHLESQSEELSLHATQIEAYSGYIATKKLHAEAGYNSYTAKGKSVGGDVEINMMTGAPSFGASYSQFKEESEVPMTVNIRIHGDLTLKVAGKASLTGVSLSAKSLEASFNSLLLESVKTVHKKQGKGFNLGLGFDKSEISGFNVGGHYEDGSYHMVEQLTEILGTETATIVVAEALVLNGAMIAGAERNADGSYTDHGQMSLTVGELFIKHLHGWDQGKMLGAAIGVARSSPKSFHGEFEGHDIVQTVRATIGQGNFTITGNATDTDAQNRTLEELNRDVRESVELRTNYKVEKIKLYYSDKDREAALQDIKNAGTYNPMTWLNKAVQHVKGEMTKLSDWLFAKNEEEKPQPEEEAPVEEKDSDQIEQDPPEAPKRSKLDEQYDAWLLRGHALIDKNQDIPDDMKHHYKDELAKEARNYAAMTNEEREKRHSELWAQYRTLKSTPEYNSLNLLEQEARNQRELYDKYGDTGDVPLSDDDPRLHKSAAPAVVAAYCAGGNELAAATIIFLGSLMGWKYLQQKQNYEPLGTHEKTIDSYGQSGKNKPHGGVSTPASPDPDDDWEPEEEHYKGWVKRNGKWHHPEAKDWKGIPNRPNAQDPKLQKLYRELWRYKDEIPGGSAEMLRNEVRLKDSNPQHLTKVINRITEISSRIMRAERGIEPLSRSDLETARRVLNDLKDALNKMQQ